MSNRSRTRNAFESALNGGISDSTTTIALDSTSGLVDPLWLVIEPDSPTLREFIRVGGLSGSDLTSVSRGEDGSAAGAQAHASGVPVRAVFMHQQLDDVFTDIEALETADSGHFGGTDVADHPEVTTSVRGFMSGADKTRLDAITDVAAIRTERITSTQALTVGTWVTVIYNSIIDETDPSADISHNISTGELTLEPGWWLLQAGVRFTGADTTTASRGIRIRRGGFVLAAQEVAEPDDDGLTEPTLSVSTMYRLASSQVITAQAIFSGGTAEDVAANSMSFLAAVRLRDA